MKGKTKRSSGSLMNNWDFFWSIENLESFWLKYHHKMVFKIYKKFLDELKLKNLSIIELGCGSGDLTIRMIKRYGGSATLVDNSKKAIEIAKKNFEKHNLKAKFLLIDLFHFNPKMKFDIVHSEGLIEHFVGNKQKKIIEIHKRCVKKDGYILVCVPRPIWYYKIWRWYLEKRSNWYFGFERAINKNKLKLILEKSGLKVIKNLNYFRYSFALAKI